MKTLLLDCDGILADFVSPFVAIYNRLSGHSATHDDIVTWDLIKSLPNGSDYVSQIYAEIDQPGFARDVIKPYPGAVAAVRELQERAHVLIVTSPLPTSPTWEYDRRGWLRDHFGILRDQIISTSAKQHVQGDVFVDDNPDNVDVWRAYRQGTGLCYARNYNRGYDGPRIESLSEVMGYL